MMKVARLLAGLCSIVCLLLPANAQKPGIHEDGKKGFRVKVPEKWTTVPVQIDEKWIVAKFLSNRSYEAKSRNPGEGGEHKPLIQVIEFDDEARKLRIDEEKRGDTTYMQKNAPYRDYKDYLKRNIGEGWYIEKEEAATEAGVACTKYSVRIEKGASMKRRLITWVFRGEKGEFAVECEALEDHLEKLQPTMLATLKSFKLIPRTTIEATASYTGGGGGDAIWVKDRQQWRQLPIEERQRRRKRIEEERMEKMQKDLLPGWTAKRTKHYLVLSHADAKYTARIVEAVEAYRTWLEDSFDTVSDEYVMHGVIRVCADADEAATYLKGSNNSDSFNADNREVVTYQDKSEGNAGIGWGRLFMGMFDQYTYDKDALLYTYLPLWIHRGLHGYVASAKIKGGKLLIEPTDEENNRIRESGRADTFLPLKELMGPKLESEIKTSTDAERDDYARLLAQGVRLVRFFYGSGSKEKALEGFVVDYMKRTITLAEQMDRDRRNRPAEANSEEEELKRTNETKTYWKRSRTDVIERIQKDQGWSEEVWSSLQKAFHEYLKKSV